MKRRSFTVTSLDLQCLTTILCILTWMIALSMSKMRPEIVKDNDPQQISNGPEEDENVLREKVKSERTSAEKREGKRKAKHRYFYPRWSWFKFVWPDVFGSVKKYHNYDNHFNKYRPPRTTTMMLGTTTRTTTEFIPDDPEDVTDPATPWPKIELPLDHLNPPIRMGNDARFNNGTLCRENDEISECWSDGNCRWFEICKTVNCRTSCHRRKGGEWKLVMHDSVGIYPKDIDLFEPKFVPFKLIKASNPKIKPIKR